MRASVAGSVHGRVYFKREAGVAVAELAMSGAATLECQRCMKPMELPVDTVVRVGLVGSEADVGRVPEDLEPMLAPGGRVSIGELITEEMLLTLPIVALHEQGERCGAGPAPQQQREADVPHRPFARLAELLKR
ncbi:MAG TPA: YceD family protein [Steroidobacteraceae bacterium]